MNYYQAKMKNQTTPSVERPVHWTYIAVWLALLCLPFLLVFGFHLSPAWIFVWLLFLFF